MPVSINKWKRSVVVLLFFVSSFTKAQSVVQSSFKGKQYLSPQGWYLHFFNDHQALSNVDTVTYRIDKDTLHLTAIRTWIGERRHQFKEEYFYSISSLPDGLSLQPISLPGVAAAKETIILKELNALRSNLSQFRNFKITRKEYLTSGGESDTPGKYIKTDTVYTITSVSLNRNKTLIQQQGHLKVTHSLGGNSEKYSQLQKKKIKLSHSAYRQKLNELAQARYFFMKDNPCQTHSLNYRFEYREKEKAGFYRRCWLNVLEAPLINWINEMIM
jgi:hypothetical protein